MDDSKKKKKPKSPKAQSAFLEVQEALENSPRYNKKKGTLRRRITGTWVYKEN